MKISSYFPQKIIEEANILSSLADYLPSNIQSILIITGKKAWQATKASIEKALNDNQISFHKQILEAYPTSEVIQYFSDYAKQKNIDGVIAVGGGKVCDVGKAVADNLNCFLMTIPTIAATNAAFRKNSILYQADGAYIGAKQNQKCADVLLIDATIIEKAPNRYLKAGLIDAVSRAVDTKPYTLADSSDLTVAFIYQNAQLSADFLLKIGEIIASRQLTSDEFAQTIDAIINIVGVAGAKSKGRMYRGVTHPLHNELTKLIDHHELLHGEIIALTTLVQLILEQDNYDWYLQFLKNIDFKVKIKNFGLTDTKIITQLSNHFILHFTDEVSFFIPNLSEPLLSSAINEAFKIIEEGGHALD
ncbi:MULTISPECIES: iron-containing alcohol dehydrogenase [unclassified Enterococcus]|uniref:iron-containing alcohol dehydrogenase n=1 Tax=unclassified Enterococcus TaxID=2608891 RepID=UPI001555F966|nr:MULTISPECIES: iron-containing alcohol dehydrogenase [unclassified Enterococcus]MBS7578091.1 iron-containing alcohol dehydrogenase [Enterococcus sp. MMGLQ5-2]MBS7585351.1 iron-containing alcohol dehydrogenase [Enterococcus sp. MMGLQ5-1]NPD13208.1 iron-containing alcohol dehydrogenase [Enterococcus sp. MMGLQ5-1]NPD37922.1 iron-containing alcohol dehydrogenase [Enterococcus sp. MMGLQ5-2]